MLNILSTAEKKKILVKYRLRLAVVAVFAVGSLLLASLVLLAPSYLLAVSKYNTAEKELAILEEKYTKDGKEKDTSMQVRYVNNKISLLSSGGAIARPSPSQIIINILKIKGDSIKIHSFMYDSNINQERLVLSGIARNRDSLALFVENLKKDSAFTNVTLPVSSYVKSTNIDFSIVVEIRRKPTEKK